MCDVLSSGVMLSTSAWNKLGGAALMAALPLQQSMHKQLRSQGPAPCHVVHVKRMYTKS